MGKKGLHRIQISLISILLAMTGGMLGAYTFIERGGVFANAQTGNMVMLGYYIVQGEYSLLWRYLIPIIIFSIGVLLARSIQRAYQKRKHLLKWQQLILIWEMLVLGSVMFIPKGKLDIIATGCISFICALQASSFRTIEGVPYGTTFCTGNLRNMMENIHMYAYTKDRRHMLYCGYYCLTLLSFVGGAMLGMLLVMEFAQKGLLGSIVGLFLATLLLAGGESQ